MSTSNTLPHQSDPLSKPPVAINMANKANNVIEDDHEALQNKQNTKDPRALNNASPINPDIKSKSPDRPMIKQPFPDTTPKKSEVKIQPISNILTQQHDQIKSKTTPMKSVTLLKSGPGSLYDPFEEIAAGKSEE